MTSISSVGEVGVCSVNGRTRDDYLFSFVGTDVLGGPMSCRLQIVYPFAIKIKATYGNEIFIFCFMTAEDVGPYKFDIIFIFRQQTNARCSATFAFLRAVREIPLTVR